MKLFYYSFHFYLFIIEFNALLFSSHWCNLNWGFPVCTSLVLSLLILNPLKILYFFLANTILIYLLVLLENLGLFFTHWFFREIVKIQRNRKIILKISHSSHSSTRIEWSNNRFLSTCVGKYRFCQYLAQ